MAQTEEEKKRKLKSAPWLNKSNPMSTYNKEGKPITLNKTPRIINVIDNLKNTAEYRKSINDPTKAFSAEASANEKKNLKFINSRPDRVGQGTRIVEKNILPVVNTVQTETPKINETPNVQRDTELGKMNISTNGDTTTYAIGGNTLSYEGDKGKINLRNINRQSGRQQPTWDDYRRQQQARYDAYINSPRGRFFGATPLESKEPVDDSIGGMFVRGLQSKQARADSQIANAEADQDINRANFLSTLDRNQIARDQLSLDADKNRIDEQGVIAENKLRDIQGQVLQNPPDKERRLKPMIIEESDPIDPTGNTKRQRLLMPNDDDTGYVDDTPASTNTPQVTTEQRSKINALIKANPNINREVILQKIANGEI